MEAKAYLRYVRISPRKIQIVCDLIRGKDAQTAMAILMQTPKAASEPLMKLLKSACANAENNFSMDPEKLVVTQVFATPGPILKRMMPRAQGRAYRINKRTSHVRVVLPNLTSSIEPFPIAAGIKTFELKSASSLSVFALYDQ